MRLGKTSKRILFQFRFCLLLKNISFPIPSLFAENDVTDGFQRQNNAFFIISKQTFKIQDTIESAPTFSSPRGVIKLAINRADLLIADKQPRDVFSQVAGHNLDK